jgi:hypothetical protein
MKQQSRIPHFRALLAPLFVLGFVVSVSAQDERPAPTSPQAVGEAPVLRTAKERLGGKWTDEQRVDNCNVAIDKRGTKPRPSSCSHDSTGAMPQQPR